jgi:hypothetical protein
VNPILSYVAIGELPLGMDMAQITHHQLAWSSLLLASVSVIMKHMTSMKYSTASPFPLISVRMDSIQSMPSLQVYDNIIQISVDSSKMTSGQFLIGDIASSRTSLPLVPNSLISFQPLITTSRISDSDVAIATNTVACRRSIKSSSNLPPAPR